MTKRILTLLLALAMATALAAAFTGCTINRDTDEDVPATTTARVPGVYGAPTFNDLIRAIERAAEHNDAEAFFALMAISQVSDAVLAAETGTTHAELIREIAEDLQRMQLTFFGFREPSEAAQRTAEEMVDALGLDATEVLLGLFDDYDIPSGETFDLDVIFVELDGRWFLMAP